MPITPHFSLSQSLSHVTVEIRVPHVRVSVDSVEIVVDDCTFHFSSPPYLLVLSFPSSLVDNNTSECECAKYDPSKNGGTISLTLAKQEPAMWPDLDLMGTLLTPKNSGRGRTDGIEILDESLHEDEHDNDRIEEDSTEAPLEDIRNALRPHYGFLNMHSGIFSDLAREGLAAEMLQLPNPDITSAEERRQLRLEKEFDDFDPNRYLGDLDVEDDYIYQTAMDMKPHWNKAQDDNNNDTTEELAKQLSELTTKDNHDDSMRDTPFFTPEESAQLASIPYPLLPSNITRQQDEALSLGLLDILFAYVYDHIMTDGDPTIESSWTVCVLSSTLSWLDVFDKDSLEVTVRHCIRRTLVYPYLRNYQLALDCWKQVSTILQNGRRCIIRCLLQARNILNKSECHYLGNKLFVDPYLAWIQRHVTNEQVVSLYKQLDTLLKEADRGEALQKESLGLNLLELESQMYEEASNDSSSESDNDNSDEEDSSSDDSTCSSRDVDACDNAVQKPSSRELLDSEIACSSINANLKISGESESPKNTSSPRKLIEEL